MPHWFARLAATALASGLCAPSAAAASTLPIELAAVWEPAVRVAKSERGYSPIGVITSSAGTGTAFLIDSCHVLTTYHSLFDREEPDLSRSFTFAVGESQSSDFRDAADAIPVVVGDYSSPTAGSCEDFAVLELNRCLGDVYGTIDVAPFSIDQVLSLQADYGQVARTAGYPRTEPLDRIATYEGVVHGMHVGDPDAFGHTAGSMQGMSGGPLYFAIDGRARLIAFGMIVGGIAVEGYIADDAVLEGADAEDPALFNRAIPMTCIYERIRQFLPPAPPP